MGIIAPLGNLTVTLSTGVKESKAVIQNLESKELNVSFSFYLILMLVVHYVNDQNMLEGWWTSN